MNFINLTLSRNLKFRIKGVESVGVLKIGGLENPKPEEADSFWICYWSLSEIHPKTGKIYGLDPLDAFLNCIHFLNLLIEGHKK